MRAASLVAVLVALAAPGCRRARPAAQDGAGAAAARTRTLIDGMGRRVAVPEVIRRVVSLAPSSTEVLFAVGAGPMVLATDKYSDYPAAVAQIDKVGGNNEPNVERLLALHPDLVFTAKTANPQRTVEALERLGLAVYVSKSETLGEIVGDARTLARVVGRAGEGERLAAALEARVASVRARVAGLPAVRTLVVVWAEPMTVAGGGTHVDELVRAAGGINVAAASPHLYPTYSTERLLAQAPEVIVVGTHAGANLAIPPAITGLSSVPAVKNGRVHSVDGDLLFRPGPRVVDGIERLVALLHPGLAGAPPAAPPSGQPGDRGDGGGP